jgi:hypothetical protein
LGGLCLDHLCRFAHSQVSGSAARWTRQHLSAKPSQGLTVLSGALPDRAADAFFSSLGDQTSEDLLSGGLSLL